MQKINLAQKLSLFDEHWKPHIVGELNGQHLKLVKFKGPFTWHHHENEDELFLVVKGRFRMDFRADAADTSLATAERKLEDRSVWLEEGEMIIVPRGTEHCPVADKECHVLLFEPASTLNTGNVENDFTLKNPDRV